MMIFHIKSLRNPRCQAIWDATLRGQMPSIGRRPSIFYYEMRKPSVVMKSPLQQIEVSASIATHTLHLNRALLTPKVVASVEAGAKVSIKHQNISRCRRKHYISFTLNLSSRNRNISIMTGECDMFRWSPHIRQAWAHKTRHLYRDNDERITKPCSYEW